MLLTVRSPVLFVPLVAVLAAGCDSGEEPSSTDIDLDAVHEASRNYRSDLEAANPVGLGSHGALMQVWLQPERMAQYQAIDPDNPVATEFAEGTLIVKEHLDADLVPFETTVMYKGPEGYNPEAADWWYGKFDADGELVVGGKDLVTCVDCHSTASVTDYIYGIPNP